jgi:hypothetical protein
VTAISLDRSAATITISAEGTDMTSPAEVNTTITLIPGDPADCYEAAWNEWDTSGDAEAWDQTSADGLDPTPPSTGDH